MCINDSPIRYDSRTTPPELVAQIKNHNAVWVCLCRSDLPENVKQACNR